MIKLFEMLHSSILIFYAIFFILLLILLLKNFLFNQKKVLIFHLFINVKQCYALLKYIKNIFRSLNFLILILHINYTTYEDKSFISLDVNA